MVYRSTEGVHHRSDRGRVAEVLDRGLLDRLGEFVSSKARGFQLA
ncbi:hypothetical protein [Streptomyces sp.]|nr:hypothetical protein [Streptomyces sp.]